MSSAYSHLRQGGGKNASELKTLIRAEVEQQERLEAMGYQSPTWRLLRALKSLLSAVQLQGESAVTASPFFPSAGRGTTRFWCKEQGPTVFLLESLGEEGREEKVIRMHRDWVVWSRARPMKGDCTLRGFEHVGKVISGPRGGGGRPTGFRGASPATVTEGAGPATGRDGAPKTRLDASEFAAKSKTARRFVSLGPPRRDALDKRR